RSASCIARSIECGPHCLRSAGTHTMNVQGTVEGAMRLTRRAFVAGSSSLAAAALGRSARAGPPYIAWHDRSIDNHREEYARAARDGLGLISFCLYGERGSPLCAAVMAPRPAGVAEEQRLGFSASQWPLLMAEMASRGFAPTIVTATGPTNDPIMAAV